MTHKSCEAKYRKIVRAFVRALRKRAMLHDGWGKKAASRESRRCADLVRSIWKEKAK